MGTFMNPDTTRVIAKRIILTGHPFKVHKKTATVRYMFFNSGASYWQLKFAKKIQTPLFQFQTMCIISNPFNCTPSMVASVTSASLWALMATLRPILTDPSIRWIPYVCHCISGCIPNGRNCGDRTQVRALFKMVRRLRTRWKNDKHNVVICDMYHFTIS